MKLSPQPPSTNGFHPAPPAQSGAFFTSRPQTVFPPDATGASGAAMLYGLGRAQVGGVGLFRILWFLGIAAALFWLRGVLPGGYWVSALIVLVLGLFTLLYAQRERSHFVNFVEGQAPQISPDKLLPHDKLPVWVTGRLAVGGNERSFSWLPGFYRTFATREHTLLCLCRERRLFGFARWPEAEVGLWYAFFRAETIRALRWGELRFGNQIAPALEIDYLAEPLPSKQRIRSVKSLYIACADEATLRAVLADLLVEGQPVAQTSKIGALADIDQLKSSTETIRRKRAHPLK